MIWLMHLGVYPMKYACDFILLCFIVVILSDSMDLYDAFNKIIQTSFTGIGKSHDCLSASDVTTQDIGDYNMQ